MDQQKDIQTASSPLVPMGLWLLLLASYIFVDSHALLKLALTDTDDYMRLHQVVNWVQGAGWYDFNVTRLNPPVGVELHWSRLPDMPLFAIIDILTPVVGQQLAIVCAVILVPSLLLLATIMMLWFGSRIYDNSETATIASIYLMACIPVLAKLYPGKLDHHGWQLMLMMGLWLCLVKAYRQQWRIDCAFIAGPILAISLWVGLETLPIILLLFCFCLVHWIFGTERAAGFTWMLSSSFAFFASVLLPVHRPVSQIFQTSCDNLAINWVVAIWVGAGFFSILYCLNSRIRTPAKRLLVAAIVGGLAISTLAYVYPECLLQSPYAQLNPLLQREFITQITEVQGALYYFRADPAAFVLFLGFPMLVLIGHLFVRTESREDYVQQLTMMLLVGTLLLSFWQLRYVIFACLFAIPLGAKLTHTQRQATRSENRKIVSTVWLVMLSPLAPTGLSLMMSDSDNDPNRTVASLGYQVVDQVSQRISQQPGYKQGRSVLIAADTNLGPTILARTSHSVLAAPYHRNQQGMLKLRQFLNSETDDEARRLAKKFGIEYVLIVNNSGATESSPLFQRLQQQSPPNWLRLLQIKEAKDVLLFRVEKPLLLPVNLLAKPNGKNKNVVKDINPEKPSKTVVLSSAAMLVPNEERERVKF